MVKLDSFKVSNYPDGHKHIVSDKDLKGDTTLEVAIKSFDDLFLVAQVKAIHPELTKLRIRYLLAARCDRRFSPGEAIDLKIVCDYIKSLGFEIITVVKPHSVATEQLLQIGQYMEPRLGYIEDPTEDLVRVCYNDLNPNTGLISQHKNKICYVSPDEGASRWVLETVKNYRNCSLLQCYKHRDAQDKITIKLPEKDELIDEYDNFVIVDDLCDGGGTFIGIAREIRSRKPVAKVYLVVTHAIFSKGLQPFEGWIERIYCTDSFAKFEHPLVKQIEI